MGFTFYILSFVFGLVIGSFLGAFTYRYPAGISIADGRSFCPNCKAKISAFDNIPLLSFILLRGKCRSCHKPISIREPLIELSTGLLFLLTSFKYFLCSGFLAQGSICAWKETMPAPFFVFAFVLLAFLVAIFVIDLEHQIIPDGLVFIPLSMLFLSLVLFQIEDLYVFLLSGFVASSFLLFLNLVTLGKGMGLGDVKFALLGGFLLGYPLTIYWIFLSFIIGAVVGVFMIITKKTSFGRHIPFGPFLIAGLLIAFLFGDALLIHLPILFI